MQTCWVTSGTAAAPNYAEATGAESWADFIHKVRIALKELNETSIWLRVILNRRKHGTLPDCGRIGTDCEAEPDEK